MATGSEILLTKQQHSDLSSIAQSRALPAGYVFRGKLIVPNENPVRHSSGRRCRRNHECHEGLCHVFEAVKRIQRGECEQFRQRFQKTH